MHPITPVPQRVHPHSVEGLIKQLKGMIVHISSSVMTRKYYRYKKIVETEHKFLFNKSIFTVFGALICNINLPIKNFLTMLLSLRLFIE